jgi:hypothetical protein
MVLYLVGGNVGGWTKLSRPPVCFEGRDNGYGHFVNMGEAKLVAAIKLVYKSGKIRYVLFKILFIKANNL